jgi:ATP phosphoribosyltransferase
VTLRLGLPKGRMQEGVLKLLSEAGIQVRIGARAYRPHLSLEHTEVKLLKPQNIAEMLHMGTRDLGFAGHDWVQELGLDLVEVLDTGLDPVKLVAAAPAGLLEDGALPRRHLRIASEYEHITRRWIAEDGLDATFVHSYGATEAFPPEDADCIVDNTATGATLESNSLRIVKVLMRSTTRMYASREAWADPERRAAIEDIRLIITSVLNARSRVMIEVNVHRGQLAAVASVLPAMREPTISPLHGGEWMAVKVAAPRSELPRLVPRIKAAGGTDIVVMPITQIVP